MKENKKNKKYISQNVKTFLNYHTKKDKKYKGQVVKLAYKKV
ncbi:MAG: hypothetical protein V8R82_07730 [Clostridia bacterium]